VTQVHLESVSGPAVRAACDADVVDQDVDSVVVAEGLRREPARRGQVGEVERPVPDRGAWAA
jgi:hypothetical protein